MATAVNNKDSLRNANFRLCRLCAWDNFTGLGFSLEAALKPPHFIRFVESNSPATAGGLKILDVLLAVNNQDVSDAYYTNVTAAIKDAQSNNDRIELLVIEKRFYDFLKHKNVIFDPNLAKIIDTPTKMPADYLNFPKHQPRTCLIRLYQTDITFGFDVVQGKHDIGAFVQEVFPNSPASKTTLRKSDHIIEINDEFVHTKPINIIEEILAKRRVKGVVKLYVIDTITYRYFQENRIPLPSKEYQRSSFANRSSTESYINQNETPIISPEQNRRIHRRIIHAQIMPLMKAKRSRSLVTTSTTTRNLQLNRRQYQLQLIPGFFGFGFDVNSNRVDGKAHKISLIAPNSPAEQKGLCVGDYIVTVNNTNVEHMSAIEFCQIMLISLKKSSEHGVPLLLEVIDENSNQSSISFC